MGGFFLVCLVGQSSLFAQMADGFAPSFQSGPMTTQVPLNLPGQIRLHDFSTHNYKPSYVDVDNALEALKALGYTVIDLGANKKEDPNVFGGPSSFMPPQPVFTAKDLPVVLRLLDASKTSLQDPAPNSSFGGYGSGYSGGGSRVSTVPDIGGAYLHQPTSGAALQRLLIVHDPEQPETLAHLLDLLENKIDVPAQQIVIEALVIEVASDGLQDLGLNFNSGEDKFNTSFESDPVTGAQLPLIVEFDKLASGFASSFRAALRMLVSRGEAEVLSNPSVLVLDGRQARIQIGQQIPVTSSTATDAYVASAVEYFPVGIVLNLKPRVSRDRQAVSMQVETIISSVSQRSSSATVATEVVVAPVVDNRHVQTFVRVADNTPFIIGGLISTQKQKNFEGIPLLSSIPWLGRLFRRQVDQTSRSEIIVVLTPHVVPLEGRTFAYTTPKDSHVFESTDQALFRDSYRVKEQEVFDLDFIRQSPLLAKMQNHVKSLPPAETGDPHYDLLEHVRSGGIPGEDVLVRRMLWETIRSSDYARLIDPNKIVFLREDESQPEGYRLAFLAPLLEGLRTGEVLNLHLSAADRTDFELPKMKVLMQRVDLADYKSRVLEANRIGSEGQQHSILLSNFGAGAITPMQWLRGAIVLKRVLELNGSLPMNISSFYPGRELVYPSKEELQNSFHLIDSDIVRYWFELQHYYMAFEAQFNRANAQLAALAATARKPQGGSTGPRGHPGRP